MNEVLVSVTQATLGPIVQLVLEIVLTLLFGLLMGLLSKLHKKYNIDIDSATTDSIKKSVLTIVKSLNQSVVDDIKAAAVDGKLTKEEQSEILARAKEKGKILLSSEEYNFILKKYGSYDAAFKIFVDDAIYDLKKEAVGKLNSVGFGEYINLDDVPSHQSGEVSECLGEE